MATERLSKTAIVTGGARRIGAALVRGLAEDGWQIVIHCQRSTDEAQALADEIGGARVVSADLADPAAAARIMAAADGLPPPRLLVNNASRFVHDDAGNFTADNWDAHMAVNVRAPAFLSRAFAEKVGEGGGLIVNLGDAKLAAPNPDFFSYTVSKYALAGLTEVLARALAPRVRVCAIAPAVTLLSGAQSQENFDRVHRMNALGRGIEADDILAALRYLIASPVLTGHTLLLDAGQRFLGLGRDVQFLEPSS